jgi:hypothetical protein
MRLRVLVWVAAASTADVLSVRSNGVRCTGSAAGGGWSHWVDGNRYQK